MTTPKAKARLNQDILGTTIALFSLVNSSHSTQYLMTKKQVFITVSLFAQWIREVLRQWHHYYKTCVIVVD